MRRLILIPILLLLISYASSQSFTTEKCDTNNIYHFALKEYCSGLNPETKEIFVEKVYPVDSSFPNSISGIKVHYVDRIKIRSLLKRKTNPSSIIRLEPIRLISEKLFINIENYSSSKMTGISVYFEYNRESGKIEYLYSEIWI